MKQNHLTKLNISIQNIISERVSKFFLRKKLHIQYDLKYLSFDSIIDNSL